ncbi:hypothetical protein C2S51_026570 [Perilla frutescens var. frutescens]|nr:hypothetical protein C2S51_026570 [Perilla frutescens var. frutescens]
MEKSQKTAGDGEFEFPEAIIQRIQSLLNTKQAAQTALISTSWYRAWSTRPNLDFDERRHFRRRSGVGFSDFAMKTMQRYEDLKLRIGSFRLEMLGAEPHDQSLARELIVKAMKLGADDLNVGFVTAYPTSFVLPEEVLGSETLVRLSVTGCVIDVGRNVEVACAKLRSLNLFGVIMNGDLVRDLIPRLPFVEKHILCRRDEMSSHTYYGRLELSPFSDGRINRLVECQELKYVPFDLVTDDVLFLHEFH